MGFDSTEAGTFLLIALAAARVSLSMRRNRPVSSGVGDTAQGSREEEPNEGSLSSRILPSFTDRHGKLSCGYRSRRASLIKKFFAPKLYSNVRRFTMESTIRVNVADLLMNHQQEKIHIQQEYRYLFSAK